MIDGELRQMMNCQSETEYCRQKPAEVAQETFRSCMYCQVQHTQQIFTVTVSFKTLFYSYM